MKERISQAFCVTTAGLILASASVFSGYSSLIIRGVGGLGLSLGAFGVILTEKENKQKFNKLQEKFSSQFQEQNKKIEKLENNVAQNNQKITLQGQKNCSFVSSIQKLQYKQKEYSLNIREQQKAIDLLTTQPSSSPIVVAPLKPKYVSMVAPSTSRQASKKIYIDGNNLKYAENKLGIEIDFSQLKFHLSQLGKQDKSAISFKYYTDDSYRSSVLVKKLNHLGYESYMFPTSPRDNRAFKVIGDDIAIAVDILEEVQAGDEVILVTGDGDFYPVVEALQKHKAHVIVVGKLDMTSPKLQQLADEFVSLDSLQYKIALLKKIDAA